MNNYTVKELISEEKVVARISTTGKVEILNEKFNNRVYEKEYEDGLGYEIITEINNRIKTSGIELGTKTESPVSTSLEDFYKNPDSQFIDLDKLEPNYDDDYYNSIAAGSNYAAPSEDDFNLIFAKPKKPSVSGV